MDSLDKRMLGRNIRQARCHLGLTQGQMAELIDMAPEVYGRMERGHILPRLERFVAICRVLGESPDKLISKAEEGQEEELTYEERSGARFAINVLKRALGPNLRQCRRQVGWTQEETAKKAHMSAAMYGRLERGTCLPTLVSFVLICRVLGEMSDRLLGLDKPQKFPRVRRPKQR
jgi:transcriptional regulator with XRE-family HTH domain